MRHFRIALLVWVLHALPAFSQGAPERFWIAGRYDGSRVIVYFDTVKFGGTIPADAGKIPDPVAEGFFSPQALSERYVASFQRGQAAERFKVGDRYDLMMDNGVVGTFTLTSLVGFESDEGSGNDSYIGALGTLDRYSLSCYRWRLRSPTSTSESASNSLERFARCFGPR